MPARVKRVIVASPPSDNVTAGRIRCRKASQNASKRPASRLSINSEPVMSGGGRMSVPSLPRNGSQWSCIANSICSMIANQKAAIATPVIENRRSAKSGQRL